MSHSRWNPLPPIPERHRLNSAGLNRIVAQLLYNRGLTEPSQLEIFFAADERLSNDPFLLPGVHEAVTRIYRALLSGEKIAVYGDFDTDGVTATALMVQGLSALGCQAIPYIPHRLTEGYGLKNAALEKLCQEGTSLVITVDCGITALREVKKANQLGIDVIITDHHTPPDIIPSATAVINPKLSDSNYPFTDLAGVGVALKLMQALFKNLGKEGLINELIDLVALGTVADVVPLLEENRYVVKQGLKRLNDCPRLGVQEMINLAGLKTGKLDSESISWTIAPRLNAAGRLEHAIQSYQLLMTKSTEEARELALWLEQKNTERQNLTVRALTKAREQIEVRGILPLLITGDCDFQAGICGLVAGKLSEEYYRPAIVIRTGDQFSSGSCRSIPEFNIIGALTKCSRLFTQFGGHPQAAGFTILTRNLPYLEQALLEIATAELAGVDLRPTIDVDAEITLRDLGGNTFPSIQKLAPFGQGNPAPTFLSRWVEVIDSRSMGNGEHLRLKLKQGGTIWDGVGFGLGKSEVFPLLNIVFNMEMDRWNGEERLRLNILDFEAAK
ncbi:MAG: single-stranded-DNA-specific exonuclease RecJ [Chloroflexota bacterium]